MRTVRKALFTVFVIAAVQAEAQPPSAGPTPITLFSVQGKPVTTEEFIYLYKKNTLKAEDFTEPKINHYVDLLINFKLKVAEARSRGLDTTAAFRKEFDSYRQELKKPYQARQEDIDRLTREAYQRLGVEVRASHILVTLKAESPPPDTAAAYGKIMAIRNKLSSGADFQQVAKETSEDPSAKSNGGDLGYFTALQMVYPFEQAAYTIKMGALSNPIRTRFGYHLIKVTDRRPARGEVEVAHIMLRSNGGDDKKTKDKIFEIDEQLKAGKAWDELCKEYSDDPATRNSGGKLRPFGVGALAGVPEFEAAAFALKEPGQVSDPFRSAYGWHLVKLIRKLPVPPYEEVESALKQKISRDERVVIADRLRREDEKKRNGYRENAEIRNWFITAADTSLRQGKWNFTGDDAIRSKVVFVLNDTPCLADEFIQYIRRHQHATSLLPGEYMQQLLDQLVDEKLNRLEDERLIREHPEIGRLLNEYEEGILLFTIMEQEIWSRVTEDSASLRKFYELNREKYKAGERVRARLLSSIDKDFMDEAERRITAGDTLTKEDLRKFKSIQPFRNYQRNDNKAVDKITWTIGIHRTEVEGTQYLVEVERLLPPGTKSLDEARAQVIAEYQDNQEKQWLITLRNKYPVKINNRGRKIVLHELTQK